jgi:predicted transcriptional regulator
MTLYAVYRLAPEKPVTKTVIYEYITGKARETRSINNRFDDLAELGLISLEHFGKAWNVKITPKGEQLVEKLALVLEEDKECVSIPKKQYETLQDFLARRGEGTVEDYIMFCIKEKIKKHKITG